MEEIKAKLCELAKRIEALPLFNTSKKLVIAEICLRGAIENIERVLGEREPYFDENVRFYDSVRCSEPE